jgi:hypothetical protein
MANTKEIEKVRQEIMRFRELLNVMRARLDDGERAYARLFAHLPEDETAGLKEKDVQWKLAETLINDRTALARAVGLMRFEARTLEHGFEELHDIITTPVVMEADES